MLVQLGVSGSYRGLYTNPPRVFNLNWDNCTNRYIYNIGETYAPIFMAKGTRAVPSPSILGGIINYEGTQPSTYYQGTSGY